ncbi:MULTISPECIES: hypothetical protein [unclassified Haloferax]|jgi:hypothetical protein|uniref:DUF7521 family protein n=1 Tax=unclassified Haloferax TaxID=2625095 RepID=UPI0028748FDF|nr:MULTISPECIES: hypothetical protein [unclassified Haloferax]MDS0243193.1 hypothetical protein [Haloferax sp. S2CR25]MDS0446314.1 hypothetical protein [Haloferax sp. S2CR25-2]
MHPGLIVAKLVTMVLGFLIAYQAYRGYRRNHSRPMLYVAIGFVFISFGAVIEGLLFDIVGLTLSDSGTVATIIVAVGMLSVLYALYGRDTKGVED